MTPEEIIKLVISEMGTEDEQFYYENVGQKAIEAIKAYAREMCDKQKMECVELMPDHLHGMEVYEVLNAPYPKELL